MLLVKESVLNLKEKYFMTDPLDIIIFDDFAIWLLGYRIEFSYMCIQRTCVIYFVVITRQSKPPISKCSRQCNEFTSVWSMFPCNRKVNVYVFIWESTVASQSSSPINEAL